MLDPRLQKRCTPKSGNGVFATGPIPANTLILSPSTPAFLVIYKPYRKEVCAFCLGYNLGRHWKVKSTTETGFVFCSEDCLASWEAEYGLVGIAAFSALEKFLKVSRKGGRDDGGYGDEDVGKVLTSQVVEKAWCDAVVVGQGVLLQRGVDAVDTSKALKRVKAFKGSLPIHVDTFMFIVSGLLYLYKHEKLESQSPDSDREVLDELCQEDIPYINEADLFIHMATYLYLLAILPLELLHLTTPKMIGFLASVSYHNAFGVRSVDNVTDGPENLAQEDPGSELLGRALMPEASFFNHSCSPNVRKLRTGRAWKFYTNRDVAVDEEICITYLGGDEKTMGIVERQETLKSGWDFVCACGRCRAESSRVPT